ncbi:MAG: hypothetical protein ACRDJK_07180 [Actinomycetota bacterium]
MTTELIVPLASVLAILALGVLIGYGFSERRRATRAGRQEAAQLFLYRQLHELRAARRKNYPARMNVGPFHKAQ